MFADERSSGYERQGNNFCDQKCCAQERQARVISFVGVVDFRIFFESCRKNTGGGNAITYWTSPKLVND
jgi:hypothetical protein